LRQGQVIGKRAETPALSGGQRQAVAVARAVAFGGKVIVMDEPTAALGVREGGQVVEIIRQLRSRGLLPTAFVVAPSSLRDDLMIVMTVRL
jgi:ABC-type sugar transport system ATPase subunit